MTTLTAAAPPPGGAMVSPGQRMQATAESGLTPADFLRILRQRLVLIIILWILFSAIAVAVTGLMVKYFPKYHSRALIEVKSIAPVNPLDPFNQQRVTRRDEVEELLASQALLVVAPKVKADTVQDAKVRGTQWFAWAETQKNEAKEDLLDDIVSAGPIRDSNFLAVSATWRNAEDLPKIINTLVDKYLAEVDRMQRAEMRTTQDQLESEISRALSRLTTKNAEIEKARASGDMVGVVGEIPAPNERLLTLIALVTELEVETLGRKSQWDALQNSDPEQLPITPDMQAIIAADPKILTLENKLMMAEEALEATSDRFGSEHKMVKNARSARDRSEIMVRQERSLKLVRLQAELVEQARRNWLEAQDQLLVLKEKLQTAMAEQRDKDKKFASYLRMMEDRELLKLQYEEMLKQKDHLAMLLGQKKSVQIALRSPAQIPKRRSSPIWLLWVPGGSFLGLLLACGIALLLDLADKSVRTPRDVSRVPVLGMIPTADDDEVEIERVETACMDVPHSMIAESFRNLRASLFFSAPAEQQGVLLVTSPSGGNGKTTIASNLAISIALSGRRVLLIDSNFRRPTLPRVFAGMREEGLSNVLIGQGRLESYVTQTSVPGLDVLSAGPTPPNPAELLGSSYLRDVVVDARSRYDQVIFDGPPVLLVSDAMVLAGAVDGTLVICQYRATSRGAMQRTQRQLEAINARVFGAILNKVETRAGGYFRKAYREFYEYGEPEEFDDGKETPQLDVASSAEANLGSSSELGSSSGVDVGSDVEMGTTTTPVDQSGSSDVEARPPSEQEPEFPHDEQMREASEPTPIVSPPTDDLLPPLDDLSSHLDEVEDLGSLDGVDEVDLGGGDMGTPLPEDDLDGDDFKINDDYDLGEDLEDPGEGDDTPNR